jgi:hypothetical protein
MWHPHTEESVYIRLVLPSYTVPVKPRAFIGGVTTRPNRAPGSTNPVVVESADPPVTRGSADDSGTRREVAYHAVTPRGTRLARLVARCPPPECYVAREARSDARLARPDAPPGSRLVWSKGRAGDR